MKRFAALLALALAGCATTTPEPVIRTVQVSVPVPVACVPKLSPPPAYADTDEALRAAPDLFSRVRLLVAGRLQRIAREGELTAAIKGCS